MVQTFLTTDNTERLQSIFKNENSWIENLQTLCVLRSLVRDSILINDSEPDTNNPTFRLLKLTNDLVGALLQDGYYVDGMGNLKRNGLIVNNTIDTPLVINAIE